MFLGETTNGIIDKLLKESLLNDVTKYCTDEPNSVTEIITPPDFDENVLV